jgi:16S rRNA (uracil1498-N3)-methyltransferase
MVLPFFYINEYDGVQTQLVLNEETSKHIVQVLRMKVGEQLNLTDGKGTLLTCVIISENKRHCEVEILSSVISPLSSKKVTIAISLLKNTNRFEWFLEKATELGVNEIMPLICDRTEKEKFRFDRMNGICISAMLQSQQTWLPVLQEPVLFQNFINSQNAENKFIAHCIDGSKQALAQLVPPLDVDQQISTSVHSLICIGPEGDFTKTETESALKNNFAPVSLGNTRLRTETAGIVAATLLVNSSS